MNTQSLTMRETEVAKRLSRGMSDQGIADELAISIHTARTHVKRIRHKPGVRGRG